MLHCGGDCWNELMETRGVVDCRFLARKATQGWSISITYILFPTKMQKRICPY